MKSSLESPLDEPIISVYTLTSDQLHILKAKSKEDGNKINYSSNETLSNLVWKCVCKACGLSNDQESRLHILVDGLVGKTLQPALPTGYFGNVIFHTNSIATAGAIKSNPGWYAASQVHDA